MEPQARIGLAGLTKMAFEGVDLHPLRSQLLSQCLQNQDADGAFMDLSVIEQLHGNREIGLEWQAKALERHRIFSTNRRQTAQAKLLVFAEPSHMGGNTPIEFLLQNSDFEIITYYPSFDSHEEDVLPQHDVAFCAAPADSEKAQEFFQNVRNLTEYAVEKTINLPHTRVNLERDALEKIFPYVDGLRFPKTTHISRHSLKSAQNGGFDAERLRVVGDYPYIIRPVGSHAGVGLAKLNNGVELLAYISERDEQEFFLSEFINYTSPFDGNFRKYRIVFVDGEAFPCHLAIADQWDLWYLNAKMHEFEGKRREEEAFMETFENAFRMRHRASLKALTEGIELDYFGVDCAEDANGNLVIFEADNALIVHDMDCDSVFPYKRKHMRRIFEAFENMLHKNCQSSGESGPMPKVNNLIDHVARPHA